MSDLKHIDKIKVESYQKSARDLLSEIKKYLTLYLNFEVSENNNLLNFEMGGCGYNIYLSRACICLEEEDNSSIENIYNVESVSELVDLIKDLKEDV